VALKIILKRKSNFILLRVIGGIIAREREIREIQLNRNFGAQKKYSLIFNHIKLR
jgi:hypothetical protein